MVDKITSLRIDSDLWRRAKVLAAKRGVTLKSIIEELLSAEVEVDELAGEEIKVSEDVIKALEEERRRGRLPFTVISEKSAVQLVREGRGA